MKKENIKEAKKDSEKSFEELEREITEDFNKRISELRFLL